MSPNHKNQHQSIEYDLKVPSEDDGEVRYDALEADINTDEPMTVTPITTTSTKQDQYIKENTST